MIAFIETSDLPLQDCPEGSSPSLALPPRSATSPERLALDLYAAALDGTPLEPALAEIARALGAGMFLLQRADRNAASIANSQHVAAHGIPPDTIEKYAQGWIQHDPWMQASRGLPSGVVNLTRLVPPEDVRRSLYWNEFLRREVPTFHGLSLLIDDGTGLTGFFTVWRPPTGHAFGPHDDDLLTWFRPHVERAFRAAARQAGAGSDAGTLDAFTHGIATLGPDGAPRDANLALQRMVSQADGIALDRFGLRLAQPGEQAQLDRAVAAALAASRRGTTLTQDTLCVATRRSGAPPYLIEVLPVPRRAGGRRGEVVLLVMDTGARRSATPAILTRLFGLTPAEAALAVALSAGQRLEEHARRHSITLATARTHLARVFAKTGCGRQGELVALLARLAK